MVVYYSIQIRGSSSHFLRFRSFLQIYLVFLLRIECRLIIIDPEDPDDYNDHDDPDDPDDPDDYNDHDDPDDLNDHDDPDDPDVLRCSMMFHDVP